MSRGQPSAGGERAAARVVLLAALTAAVLAGLLGVFAGVGVLRVDADRDAGGPPGVPPDGRSAGGPRGDHPVQPPPGERGPAGPAVDASPTPGAAGDGAGGLEPGPVPPAARPATATLLAVDEVSPGDWVGRYGGRGYWLAVAGAAPHLPPGVRATPVGSRFYDWSTVTTDPRGLAVPGRQPAGRSAGQWFAWDAFSLDLDLRAADDGYRVALYLLDWDGEARAQRLDVTDRWTGAVLLTRTDDRFRRGRYLVLRLTGHVVLRFTRTGGANCTLSGVFLDDPPPAGR